MQQQNDLVLALDHVNKSFPGVKALSDVSLYIYKGEVHALCGENGAGKSTLMKILSGAYKKDSGSIYFEGKEVTIDSTKVSEELGISIIYQELNQVNGLTVAENIYLGRQPKNHGVIMWQKMYEDAAALLERLGIDLDVRKKVSRLTIAQRQLVEIAKAVSLNAKVVIMDEPTSSLTMNETEILFSIIETLKAAGTAIIFITHRMDEIFRISDRLSVLRDGCYIGSKKIEETTKEELIKMMIGRELKQQYPKREAQITDEILKVENLSDGKKVENISFTLRKGEVLGFAGLVGSGRTETMRLIFGVDKKATGKIYVDKQEVQINNPMDSIRHKIGFVTENRKEEGLLLTMTCSFNTTIAALKKIKTHGILSLGRERKVSQSYVDKLRIVTPSITQKVGLLSGGNQQKVVLAKWLFTDCDIIILDEPTRGIDVGAKREIYEIINQLAMDGKGVIVVSSEMEEVMGICDRIIVMREGRISGEVPKEAFSQQYISKYAIGG